MLLGQPERTQIDLNFSFFGIPVRVHPFFWVIAVLLGPYRSGPAEVVLWVLAMFAGILVHELGHAVTMRAYGFYSWITLYGFGGLASCEPRGTYQAKGSGTVRQIFISAAGPAAGFLLAGLLVAAILAAGYEIRYVLGAPFGLLVGTTDVIWKERLSEFLNNLLFVCVAWGILNLLPVYPLDGGQIAREVFLRFNPREGIRRSLILSMITAIGLAVYALSLGTFFLAFLFGYLAFASYGTLQAYTGRRPW